MQLQPSMKNSMKPCCAACAKTGGRCADKTMQGLGFDISSFMPLATSLLGPSGGGSGGAGSPGTAIVSTVSPNIAVNPQISPIFQQAFQPSNSPMTAGTAQTAPGAGAGYAPGLDTSGAGAPLVPNVQGAPLDWNKYITYAGFGVLALLAVKLLKGKRANSVRRKTQIHRTVKRK